MVALIKAQGMAISQAFEVHLDHLEQADIAGHELLDGMVESSGRGEDSSRRTQKINTTARLKAFQDSEAAIFKTQPPGGQDQKVTDRAVGGAPLQHLVQAILAGVLPPSRCQSESTPCLPYRAAFCS